MPTTEAKKHRFSVEEYRRMGEAGIFGEDDRVELVDGEVVEMAPIGWRHVRAVNQLTDHRRVGRSSRHRTLRLERAEPLDPGRAR